MNSLLIPYIIVLFITYQIRRSRAREKNQRLIRLKVTNKWNQRTTLQRSFFPCSLTIYVKSTSTLHSKRKQRKIVFQLKIFNLSFYSFLSPSLFKKHFNNNNITFIIIIVPYFSTFKNYIFENKLFLFSSLSLQFFRHIYHFIFNLPFFLF